MERHYRSSLGFRHHVPWNRTRFQTSGYNADDKERCDIDWIIFMAPVSPTHRGRRHYGEANDEVIDKKKIRIDRKSTSADAI
mmetsp:Transcript_34942/g.48807  ORF Transcript_34942/g.48807 Transcript_34942/m.48807 type:complete len:82 (-) Transcript_34942:53-298(-)